MEFLLREKTSDFRVIDSNIYQARYEVGVTESDSAICTFDLKTDMEFYDFFNLLNSRDGWVGIPDVLMRISKDVDNKSRNDFYMIAGLHVHHHSRLTLNEREMLGSMLRLSEIGGERNA